MAVGVQIKVFVGFLRRAMFELSDSSEECIAFGFRTKGLNPLPPCVAVIDGILSNPFYTFTNFLPPYHFSSHLNQLSLPEDRRTMLLRNF